jgi:hypothetical protein
VSDWVCGCGCRPPALDLTATQAGFRRFDNIATVPRVRTGNDIADEFAGRVSTKVQLFTAALLRVVDVTEIGLDGGDVGGDVSSTTDCSSVAANELTMTPGFDTPVDVRRGCHCGPSTLSSRAADAALRAMSSDREALSAVRFQYFVSQNTTLTYPAANPDASSCAAAPQPVRRILCWRVCVRACVRAACEINRAPDLQKHHNFFCGRAALCRGLFSAAARAAPPPFARARARRGAYAMRAASRPSLRSPALG